MSGTSNVRAGTVPRRWSMASESVRRATKTSLGAEERCRELTASASPLPTVICCVVACFLLLPAAEAANRIIAVVNNDVITEGDVMAHMTVLLQQQEDRPSPTEEEAQGLWEAVLQRLIEERLIVQEAKRLDLSVDPDEVTARLQAIREELGSQEAYERMLQEAQLGEEQLKLKLREQLLAQKAIDRSVRAKIVVSPAELARVVGPADSSADDAGEEVLASHLLVRIGEERSAEEVELLIQRLREQLQQGADFGELARQYSEGAQAEEGGQLGWVRPGELRPELDAALVQLPPGEVSEPIRSPLGVHLIKVLERRRLSEQERLAEREQLERRLYHQKFVAAMERWLGELRQRAYIQLMDE